MEKKKTVFETLNGVNVNGFTEQRNGLTYLTWSKAWEEVVTRYPDASYEIVKDEDGIPYFESGLGFMVYTKVTIEGVTREMWLPVMDSANNAMKSVAYDFSTFSKYGEKKHHVNAATMFDVNKTIMRCLTKNLAMFGLGLYIYSGEDLPTEEKEANAKAAEEKAKEEFDKMVKEATAAVKKAKTADEVKNIYRKYNASVQSAIKDIVVKVGKELASKEGGKA